MKMKYYVEDLTNEQKTELIAKELKKKNGLPIALNLEQAYNILFFQSQVLSDALLRKQGAFRKPKNKIEISAVEFAYMKQLLEKCLAHFEKTSDKPNADLVVDIKKQINPKDD